MDIHRSRFVPFPAAPINAIAFSRSTDKGLNDPRAALKLAIGRDNGSIEIWSAAKGDWVQEVVFPGGEKSGGERRSIDGLLWTQEPDETSPDGKAIVGQLRLFGFETTPAVTEWNLETGRPLRVSTGNFSEVWCFAAQPRWKAVKSSSSQNGDVEGEFRGQNIVAGCGDGTLAVLSTADNDLEFKRFLARSASRKARCMSVVWQNRDTIIAGFTDSSIRVYDARNGSLTRNMSLGAGIPGAPKDTLVWRLKCLPTGDIVAADSNGEVTFWDGRTYSLVQRVTGHESDCLDLVTSSDGQTVFSGGMDGRLAVYKLSGKEGEKRRWAKSSHRKIHNGDVKSMAVYDAKSMSVVVSGGLDASPVVTPLKSHNKELHRRVPGLPQASPCASAPSKRLLVSWWDSKVCIWRLADQAQDILTSDEQHRKLVTQIILKGTESILTAAISQDGNMLAVSTAVATKLFQLRPARDEEDDRLRVRTLELPQGIEKTGSRLLDFSPNGQWLAYVSLQNEVNVARIATPDAASSKLQVLATTVELERLSRKITQQSGLKLYERTIARLAFSPDSSVLVAGDLSGYLDSWVLEGHYDSTAPAMDTTSGSSASDSDSDSAGSSDSDSDSSDDDEETVVFYGQHWTGNHKARMLPKLDSAPLILSFRPSATSKAELVNGNPGVHPTRANPHAHAHTLPERPSTLLVVTAHHQIHDFDVLAGGLTDWSRRNPTSVMPPELRTTKDRAMGLVWDVQAQRERAWLYGSSWVGMLDLSQDFPLPSTRKDSDVAAAAAAAAAADGETTGKKRKRRESERWSQLDDTRKKLKGASGAGDRVKDGERNGVPGALRRIENGEAMDVDLDARPAALEDADDDNEQAVLEDEMLGPLRRLHGRDAERDDDDDDDDDDGDGQDALEGRGRRWWCTYKYRPILGMVPIGVREQQQQPRDGEESNPLEVVLVERPYWDLPQMQALADGM